MPICLSGLDLSFLRKNDPNAVQPGSYRYDAEEGVIPAADHARKHAAPDRASEGIAVPSFMPDIKPFVQVSTRNPSYITSRSELRRFERSHGLKQAGDIPVGSIAAEHNAKAQDWAKKAKGVDHGWMDPTP